VLYVELFELWTLQSEHGTLGNKSKQKPNLEFACTLGKEEEEEEEEEEEKDLR
jgi:hypothetical protein